VSFMKKAIRAAKRPCHALLNHAAYLVLAPHQLRHVSACLALPPRPPGCPAAYQGDDDDDLSRANRRDHKTQTHPILPLRDSEKPLNSFFCTRGLGWVAGREQKCTRSRFQRRPEHIREHAVRRLNEGPDTES